MSSKENLKYARELLRAVGVERALSPKQYASRLQKRFGQLAEQVFEAVAMREEGHEADIYTIKNSSLELSLAVTAQGFQHIHEAFLAWLVGEFAEAPKSVLDIGCESGVLTCAMAKHWPSTQVVGIEPNEAAAAVARQLVERLGLRNVEIRCCRFEDLHPGTDGTIPKFDLVIALCVFHELLGDPFHKDSETAFGFSIDDTPDWNPQGAETLRRIPELLANSGAFVAVNRWGHTERSLQWLRLTERAGLQVDLMRSYMLEARSETDGKELMPISVHTLARPIVAVTADDVLALHSYPKFRDDGDHFALEGPPAEALYRGMGPKERIAGFEAEYLDGSGTERQEVLVSGPLVGLYVTSTRGYRRLALGSLAFLPEMIRGVQAAVEHRQSVAAVEWLDSGDPRPHWRLYGLAPSDCGLPAAAEGQGHVPEAVRHG